MICINQINDKQKAIVHLNMKFHAHAIFGKKCFLQKMITLAFFTAKPLTN